MASRVMARVPSSNGTPCAEVLDGKTYAVKLIRRPSLLDTVNMTAYAACTSYSLDKPTSNLI